MRASTVGITVEAPPERSDRASSNGSEQKPRLGMAPGTGFTASPSLTPLSRTERTPANRRDLTCNFARAPERLDTHGRSLRPVPCGTAAHSLAPRTTYQDPDQVRTDSAWHSTFPLFVAGQERGQACTTSRRRNCWRLPHSPTDKARHDDRSLSWPRGLRPHATPSTPQNRRRVGILLGPPQPLRWGAAGEELGSLSPFREALGSSSDTSSNVPERR